MRTTTNNYIKIIILIIFIFILFIPLNSKIYTKITNTKLDDKLNGYFISYNRPKFSWKSLLNGSFQENYNNYFKNNFSNRKKFIICYNTIRYQLFNVGNRIIGKNNSIFEYDYINDALVLEKSRDFSSEENRNKIKNYILQLERINEKLRNNNKVLLVYSTPSKAKFCFNDIPDRYKLNDRNGQRAIDVFNELIKNTKIEYIDSTKELLKYYKNDKIPVFYKTGIHWSRPAEQYISTVLIDRLAKLTKNNYKKIYLEELESSKVPYFRDSDVFDLLNIKGERNEKQYFQYKTHTEGADDIKLNILMQGDSFLTGFHKDLEDNNILKDEYYIFYNDGWTHNDDQVVSIKNFNEIPLQRILNNSDVVLIEFNEAILPKLSSGFVEYLDNYLSLHIVN